MSLKNASDVTTNVRDGMHVVSFDSGVRVSTYDVTSTWLIETAAGEASGSADVSKVHGMRDAVMKLGMALAHMETNKAQVQSYDLFRFFEYMESGGTASDPGPVDLNDPESLAKATEYLTVKMVEYALKTVL